MHVSKKRHIAKTISYRVVSTLIGFGIMWSITGSIPYDMEIVGNQAFVTVPALTIEEAVQKANEFFQNT